jgi:putative acetyltransferase
VLGNPLHYARRFSTPHQVPPPQPTDHAACWFARALSTIRSCGDPE